MTPELHDNPPLPFRRLILMPWRWSRWVLWVCGLMVVLTPLIYFLSAVPFLFVYRELTGETVDGEEWFEILYAPVVVAAESSELAAGVIDYEFEVCEAIFGSMD